MKIEVTANKEQVEAAKRELEAARIAVKESEPMMRQVAVYLDQWVQRNFKSGGEKVGKWAPFAYGGRLTTKDKANAKSIDGRRYINSNAMLLADTGALRLSMLPFVRKGIAGIGSDLPYSKPHDEGEGAIQRRMIPRSTDNEVTVRVDEIMENFILARINRA